MSITFLTTSKKSANSWYFSLTGKPNKYWLNCLLLSSLIYNKQQILFYDLRWNCPHSLITRRSYIKIIFFPAAGVAFLFCCCALFYNQLFHSLCISFKLDNFYSMLSKPDLGDPWSKDYKANEVSHILHLFQIPGEFKRILFKKMINNVTWQQQSP